MLASERPQSPTRFPQSVRKRNTNVGQGQASGTMDKARKKLTSLAFLWKIM